jgi:hypothetical protein
MNQPRRAAVCLSTHDESSELFQRRLWGVLRHTPPDQVELRLGFNRASPDLYYALGVLCPDGVTPARQALPGGVERFHWAGADGLSVWAWLSAAPLGPEDMTRLLYHDVSLAADYAVRLGDDFVPEAGWWEALAPLLEQGADYVGQPHWRDYRPAELERVQAQPWYMGMPFARRDGKLGVPYLGGSVLAVRAERLREADFPNPGLAVRGDRSQKFDGDAWLGEVARQLGWSQAAHQRPATQPSRNGA